MPEWNESFCGRYVFANSSIDVRGDLASDASCSRNYQGAGLYSQALSDRCETYQGAVGLSAKGYRQSSHHGHIGAILGLILGLHNALWNSVDNAPASKGIV
eukprot:4780759-Pleurochrysis_carterae.AAC.1